MTNEPVVEMLWEALDPQAVLSERFGYSSSREAVAWLRKVLAHHYGMSLEDCQRLVMSDSNALAWVSTNLGPSIVKWSVTPAKFARLAAISDLTSWLGSCGHPVSAPMPSRTGETQIVVDGVSVNVQRVMPGHHLEVADGGQVREAGATLARLHADLRAYPGAARVPGLARPSVSTSALIASWLESDRPNLPQGPVDALRTRWAGVSETPLDFQLVQGDFRAANVLTRGTKVTALLDFEEMRFDSAVGELARSAVMLGTLFHDWGPVAPQVHRTFLQGYESVRPLSEQEEEWWQPLLLWWSLLMVPDSGEDPTGWGQAAERLTCVLDSPGER